MKIVHLCTQDNGGAGNAAYRLNLALRKAGIDSKLIVLTKAQSDKSVYAIPDDYPEKKSLINNETYTSVNFQKIWANWQTKLHSEYPAFSPSYEIFTLPTWDIELSEISQIAEADIINLHWVAGMLSYSKATKRMFAEKKVVWTLHDINPFTGGCHYSAECEKFTKECSACPQLFSDNPQDLSYDIFNSKMNFYEGLKINIVTPSKWLSNEVKRSSLMRNFPATVIPNGFPTDVFLPYPGKIVKEKLNIPVNAKIILFGAAYGNKRKGFNYLLDALDMIEGDEKVYLGVFGNLPKLSEINGKFEIIQFGSVNDEKVLSMLYSAADVFVIPSIQDNLPNVVPEAMLCGTPVVGFRIGGIPDMIEHKVNGYLAKPLDPVDLAAGIVWALNNSSEKIRKQTHEIAINKYSFEIQAKNYTSLFRKILNEKSDKSKNINISVKKNSFPKITIVTPSYNQVEFLEETINSVLEQNYPNLEYIIMDGGSDDNSVEIIKKYENHLAYWQSKSDGGQYSAITEGFNRSTGEIMTWLNSDDLLAPLSLLTVGSLFVQFQNVDWVMGRGSILHQENRGGGITKTEIWNRKKYLTETYQFIQQEGTFWRRTLYERSGGYLSTEYSLASDLELWVRFFRHSKLYTLDTPLGIFRYHNNQRSQDFREKYFAEADEIIKKEKEAVLLKSEKLDDSQNLLRIANISLLSKNKDELDRNILNKFFRKIENKTFDSLEEEFYRIIYYLPETESLYKVLVNCYLTKEKQHSAEALLWWLVLKFNNPDFWGELILLEFSLKRFGLVEILIGELIKIAPNHPVIDYIKMLR